MLAYGGRERTHLGSDDSTPSRLSERGYTTSMRCGTRCATFAQTTWR
jgi:hypothetical protein